MKIKTVFEQQIIKLPLDVLLPTREVKVGENAFGKYNAIRASIAKVGLIEPIAIFPCKGKKNKYLVLDGHLRLKALRELAHTEAECLISTEEESFTYNDKVSRLSVVQEYKMIHKAIENGLSADEIAQTLAVDINRIRDSATLGVGLDPRVLELLKDTPTTARTFYILKRVKPPRQQEIARLMNTTGDYTFAFADSLLELTTKEMLIAPTKPKIAKLLSSEEIARMKKEMEHMESDLNAYEKTYSDNTLFFSMIQRYVQHVLKNEAIKRFLNKYHPELYEELSAVTDIEIM